MGTVCIQNCLLRCFNSIPFAQIKSQIFSHKRSLIANQIINILTEVVVIANQVKYGYVKFSQVVNILVYAISYVIFIILLTAFLIH